MPLEKIGQQCGIPAEYQTTGLARLTQQGVECGGALSGDDRFGPRHYERRDLVELERRTLDQRGHVLCRPGQDLQGALLHTACAAGQPGDGVDAESGGGDGGPRGSGRVVGADDEHGWTDPGAAPRGRIKQIP